MKRYDIKCFSLAEPEEWVYLEDTEHALKYAAEIFKDNHLVILLCAQQQDFKDIYNQARIMRHRDLDKLAFIAFQVQFQRECLDEVWHLIKRLHLSISP